MTFRFENLKIWEQSRDFAKNIGLITKGFPRIEDFALTSQLNRAAYSVGLNIAEGSGRSSSKEFIHFLDISLGSLFEVVSALAFALDKGYINQEEYNNLYKQCEAIGKSINSFKKTIK